MRGTQVSSQPSEPAPYDPTVPARPRRPLRAVSDLPHSLGQAGDGSGQVEDDMNPQQPPSNVEQQSVVPQDFFGSVPPGDNRSTTPRAPQPPASQRPRMTDASASGTADGLASQIRARRPKRPAMQVSVETGLAAAEANLARDAAPVGHLDASQKLQAQDIDVDDSATTIVAPKGAVKLHPIAPPTPGGGLPATDDLGKSPQTAAVTVLPPPRHIAQNVTSQDTGKALPTPVVGPAPISEPLPEGKIATPLRDVFHTPGSGSGNSAPETMDLPQAVSQNARPVAEAKAKRPQPVGLRVASKSAARSDLAEAAKRGADAHDEDTDAPEPIAAIIGHSTSLVTSFLTWGLVPFAGPLVLWFVYRDSHPRLRVAAAQVFNFTLLAAFAGWAGLLFAVFAAASTGQTWLFWLLAVPSLAALWGAGVGLPLWGIVQARRGEKFKYPVNPGWIS